MMETNLQKRGPVHPVPYASLGRNCKNSFEVHACCFVNNTVTYFNVWPECQILFCNFDLLHTVRSWWPDVSTKIIEKAVIITFIYFVSHASALASRSITFTQRFRTTRHLISIQLLWKPKILSVKDKKTQFEHSKGDLSKFSELCK